jgi:hypothetical protein
MDALYTNPEKLSPLSGIFTGSNAIFSRFMLYLNDIISAMGEGTRSSSIESEKTLILPPA